METSGSRPVDVCQRRMPMTNDVQSDDCNSWRPTRHGRAGALLAVCAGTGEDRLSVASRQSSRARVCRVRRVCPSSLSSPSSLSGPAVPANQPSACIAPYAQHSSSSTCRVLAMHASMHLSVHAGTGDARGLTGLHGFDARCITDVSMHGVSRMRCTASTHGFLCPRRCLPRPRRPPLQRDCGATSTRRRHEAPLRCGCATRADQPLVANLVRLLTN